MGCDGPAGIASGPDRWVVTAGRWSDDAVVDLYAERLLSIPERRVYAEIEASDERAAWLLGTVAVREADSAARGGGGGRSPLRRSAVWPSPRRAATVGPRSGWASWR